MSDIPKSRRAWSRLEAAVQAIDIRKSLAEELLASFGLSEKQLEAAAKKAARGIEDPEHAEEVSEAIRNLNAEFFDWFIKRHRDRVDDLACDISQHIRAANTIWPVYMSEFRDRRGEWNSALKACNKLQDELQYIAETLPTDKNRFINIVLEIESLYEKIKKVRQSDNRFLKTIKK